MRGLFSYEENEVRKKKEWRKKSWDEKSNKRLFMTMFTLQGVCLQIHSQTLFMYFQSRNTLEHNQETPIVSNVTHFRYKIAWLMNEWTSKNMFFKNDRFFMGKTCL